MMTKEIPSEGGERAIKPRKVVVGDVKIKERWSNLYESLKYFLRGVGEGIDLSDVDYLVYIGLDMGEFGMEIFLFFLVGFAIHHLNGIADSQGRGIRYINIFV